MLDKALKLKKKSEPVFDQVRCYDAEKASTPIRSCPPRSTFSGVRFHCKLLTSELWQGETSTKSSSFDGGIPYACSRPAYFSTSFFWP